MITQTQGSAILKHFSNYTLSLDAHYSCLEEVVLKITNMATSEEPNDVIEEELKRLSVSMKLSNDYRYFILLCGLLSPENGKNLLKLWPKYEQLFINLVKIDGEIGKKRLF